MPVTLTYPGVYVQEQRTGVVSISGVATSTALFVGMAPRGPADTPTRVRSRTAFEARYGSDASVGELPDQVRQFFLNGGSDAYVMRIAQGDLAARVELDNEYGNPVYRFEAKDTGRLGDTIRLEVDYNTPEPESTFNLGVYREVVVAPGRIEAQDQERHTNLSGDPNSARYVVTVLARDSLLVTATSVAAAPLPGGIRGISIGAVMSDTAANLRTNVIDVALAAVGGTGRFEVSVDGSPFVPIDVASPVVLNDVALAINTALAPFGVAGVTVTAPAAAATPQAPAVALVIASGTVSPASSVRLRRSATPNDIAGLLGLGTDNGGIEIGGAAYLRPMPNGIVARLGAAVAAAPFTPLVDSLTGFVTTTRANMPGIRVTDAAGPIDVGFGIVGANQLIHNRVGAVAVRSLILAAEDLDTIVGAINAAAAAVLPPNRFLASRVGYRLVLRPLTGSVDTGPQTLLDRRPADPVAAFNWAANAYMAPAARASTRAYRLGGYAGGVVQFANGTQAGNDGIAPAAIDYVNAFEVIRREVDIFNMMVLPRAVGQTDNDRAALWGMASAFCRQRRAVLLMDPRADWLDSDLALAGVIAARTGVVKDHTAVYWPRVVVRDLTTGVARTIDPAGSVAGVAARIDGSRGVWKAPAGLEADIRGIAGVERKLSDDENGNFNPAALNAIRAFPTGVVVWGARTMDGFDNSGNTDYRYLPVRRTALFIEESLYRGLQFAVFEPNDEPLWAQIRLAAGAFMNGLFRQGAFQGSKASDAYQVKCDAETTTQTDINLGIVNVVVLFAPLRPAEFVVLVIRQKAGQVQT